MLLPIFRFLLYHNKKAQLSTALQNKQKKVLEHSLGRHIRHLDTQKQAGQSHSCDTNHYLIDGHSPVIPHFLKNISISKYHNNLELSNGVSFCLGQGDGSGVPL